MQNLLLKPRRKSQTEQGGLYFHTACVYRHKTLLYSDEYKLVIIDQLQWLKLRNTIRIFGMVIMPNHIHLIWQRVGMNGKESPFASFFKWTSSQFLKKMRSDEPERPARYHVDAVDRNHRFWQRDPLAIPLGYPSIAYQKLNYIHNNPMQEKWNLVKSPVEYKWSSAGFYETGEDEFGLFENINVVF